MKNNIVCIGLLVLQTCVLFAQESSGKVNPIYKKSKVVFDNSAIEAIYLHPLEILSDADSFWTNNRAFFLTKQWHTRNMIEIPLESWKKSIQKISKLSLEERKTQIAFINAKQIMGSHNSFYQKAIPHIYSFLPPSTPEIETSVYLLTGTVPYAFTYSGDIVMDCASPNFNRDPERIINILVHEVFHIAYFKTLIKRTEFEFENEILDYITEYLFMEGLANYVAYKSQDFYPNHKFEDYVMLENEKTVRKHIGSINALFSKSSDTPAEKMKSLSWEVGVIDRGYYIVGSFMAKTIDEKLGRDSLVSVVASGPRKFIKLYNSLVNNDMRLVEFKMPEKISVYQNLRIAIARKDYPEFEKLKKYLIQNESEVSPTLEKKINEYGYSFMKVEMADALKLFEINTILFPLSSNAFDSYAEALMNSGDKELAKKCYEKAIELNPKNTNAQNKLKELEGD